MRTATESILKCGSADNGCGFDTAKMPPGRGLRHLPQRTATLNGSLVIESQPGSGTTVRLLLPIAG